MYDNATGTVPSVLRPADRGHNSWMTEYGRSGDRRGIDHALLSSHPAVHKSFFRRRGRDWEHSSKLTSRLTY
jgi:hypothetical protein